MFNLSFFVERLNEIIIEKNITKNFLIEKLSINRTTLNRYLAGTRVPSLPVMIKLADIFNCSMDYLLGFSDNYGNKSYKSCPPFKEQLHIFLEHFNTNKYQFQKKTHINESIIYDWQRGKHIPSIDNIVVIADTYNCSIDFVIGRGD